MNQDTPDFVYQHRYGVDIVVYDSPEIRAAAEDVVIHFNRLAEALETAARCGDSETVARLDRQMVNPFSPVAQFGSLEEVLNKLPQDNKGNATQSHFNPHQIIEAGPRIHAPKATPKKPIARRHSLTEERVPLEFGTLEKDRDVEYDAALARFMNALVAANPHLDFENMFTQKDVGAHLTVGRMHIGKGIKGIEEPAFSQRMDMETAAAKPIEILFAQAARDLGLPFRPAMVFQTRQLRPEPSR